MANEKCIDLDDLDRNMGCDGYGGGGIIERVIYGYWNDVAVWPDEPVPASPTTPLTLEEAGGLEGDVVMKPGTRAFFQLISKPGCSLIAPAPVDTAMTGISSKPAAIMAFFISVM